MSELLEPDMLASMITLDAALDRLHAAFDGVAKPITIDRCDHCFSDSDEAALLADRPVRTLPANLVGLYAVNVASSTVDGAGLPYFLPRILELCTTDAWGWSDLCAGRLIAELHTAGWTQSHQDAVVDFLLDPWRLTVAGSLSPEFAEPVLERTLGTLERPRLAHRRGGGRRLARQPGSRTAPAIRDRRFRRPYSSERRRDPGRDAETGPDDGAAVRSSRHRSGQHDPREQRWA